MASMQVARRRPRQDSPEQGGMQVTDELLDHILELTTEEIEKFYQEAVARFESMRPLKDRMGNVVVNQMPRLLRIVINAVNMCQTTTTPSQQEAGKHVLRDALDMMTDFVDSLQDIHKEEALAIKRAIQNRRQFTAQEQGILDKLKRHLWTERSTTEIVVVALLTCAALYGAVLGLGMISGAACAATGTAEAVGAAAATGTAEAAAAAAAGTAGTAAAAGTAGAAAAVGTAGAAAAATGTGGAAAAAETTGVTVNAVIAAGGIGGTRAAIAVMIIAIKKCL